MKRKTEKISGNESLLTDVIGKTLEQAKKIAGSSGFSTRIVREDSDNYFVTMDLRFDRLNLELDNGIVTKSDIG